MSSALTEGEHLLNESAPWVVPEGDLPQGTKFDRFVIVKKLGAGGMAVVYEAEQPALGKRVAIKLLKDDVAKSAFARMRFLREGQSACRVRHPHVVDVLDVGEWNGRPFLVLELLEGETLRERLDRVSQLSLEAALSLLLPILSAVHAVHCAGIIHRDLKPENVFLANVGAGGEEPKLLDFGISKIVGAPVSATNTVSTVLLGTPYYMAPEQLANASQVDAWSDQYALGVLLYEAVTGRRPFDADTLYGLVYKIFAEPMLPPGALCEVPEGFDEVLLRALHKDRHSRYPSVLAFAKALLPFASSALQSRWDAEFGSDDEEASPPVGSIQTSPALPTQEEVPNTENTENPAPLGFLPAQRLRTIESLRPLTERDLEVLCRVAPLWLFPAGSTLFKQGSLGSSCLLLVTGEVEVMKTVAGAEWLLNTLGPGALVGQLALVDHAPRSASVFARTEVLALELGRDSFERLLETNSSFAMQLQERIAIAGVRQLRNATSRLAQLSEKKPEEKGLSRDDAVALAQVQVSAQKLTLVEPRDERTEQDGKSGGPTAGSG